MTNNLEALKQKVQHCEDEYYRFRGEYAALKNKFKHLNDVEYHEVEAEVLELQRRRDTALQLLETAEKELDEAETVVMIDALERAGFILTIPPPATN